MRLHYKKLFIIFIVNLGPTFSWSEEYEDKVDNFLSKLATSNNEEENAFKNLKTKIIDNNNLDLSSLLLTSIPEEIGELTALKYLNLSNNRLTAIPEQIEKLTQLQKLNLKKNQLTEIPTQIGNLTSLEDLNLSLNELTEIPQEIENLTALTDLDVYHNKLEKIPTQILKLTALKNLELGANKLREIPEQIENLTALEYLSLSDNKLTEIPEQIGNLKELKSFYTNDNKLTKIAKQIGQLSALKILNLSDNKLTEITEQIGQLSALEKLDLSNNKLTEIPEQIGQLSALKRLDLSNNQLTEIPEQIGRLTALLRLNLSDNQLTQIPGQFRELTNLRICILSRNPLALEGESESRMGIRELRDLFGDRLVFDPKSIPKMPASTTKEEVYAALDKKVEQINRDKFKKARLPQIPGIAIEDGEEFIILFANLLSTMNFDDENKAGYLSYELLSGDFAAEGNVSDDNATKIGKKVISKLLGYFKTLYGLPLEADESSGWQMYESKKAATKKALTFILQRLTNTDDPDTRASYFVQLTDGILHCPTGQSEGIDTVAITLLEGTMERSSNLPTIADNLIALRKNAFFKTAILSQAAENAQNVHLIASYRDKAKDELGLSNVLDYKEKIGVIGIDPFNDNVNNVLKVYYDLVTPESLVSWLLEKTQSKEDLQHQEELRKAQEKLRGAPTAAVSPLQPVISTLQKKLESASSKQEEDALKGRIFQLQKILQQQQGTKKAALSEEEKKALHSKIDVLKGKINAAKLFRPLSLQVIREYLIDKKIVNLEEKDWWVSYFSDDPSEVESASLTRGGAKKLLVNLGYIMSN
jgi:Leucine-rich repeat (LRR) protein